MSPLRVAVAGGVSTLIPLLLWCLGNIMESRDGFGWERTFQIISFPAMIRALPHPSSLQPGLKETTLMYLPDHTFQICAREDYPEDQPHSQGTVQALGSMSSMHQLLLHPGSQESLSTQTREFYPSTNSSRRKPGPYSASKYLFQECLQRQEVGRSWRGKAAGWGCFHGAAR